MSTAIVQVFLRISPELAERFRLAVERMPYKPSRNAVLVHMIEEWLEKNENNER